MNKKGKNMLKAAIYAIVGSLAFFAFFFESIKMWDLNYFLTDFVCRKFIIKQILLFVGMLISYIVKDYGLDYIRG